MLFDDHLVVVRGGGDLATGAVDRLQRAGFPVVVLELANPLAVRRRVAVAAAVSEGSVVVDGLEARLVESTAEAVAVARSGSVAVLVDAALPELPEPPTVVIDARMAKHNIDTERGQAALVLALGPGFEAGKDCDAVIETKRGHRLGRVIWEGHAAADTGVPGSVGGEESRRVVRAPGSGPVRWQVDIGDVVEPGQALGIVGAVAVDAPIGGVVRGLIAPGHAATEGLKIGDIDPRGDPAASFEISDKARLVGGGVLEATLTWLDRRTA